MKAKTISILALLFLAIPAMAQAPSQSQPDARLSGPTISALRAMLDLREAEIKALAEDMKAKLAQREHEWGDYSRLLWAHDPVAAAKPAK